MAGFKWDPSEVTRILAISGSLRAQSTNTATLRTLDAVASAEPIGVEVSLYTGLADLPALDPDDDIPERLPAAAAHLRQAVRDADAIVFSTPEYAGGLPGSFKNLLDWTIGDADPRSIYEKPVAWLNVSPRGAVGAHEDLRTVLGYASAKVVDGACVAVPVQGSMVGSDGLVAEVKVRDVLAQVIGSLVDHLASRPT